MWELLMLVQKALAYRLTASPPVHGHSFAEYRKPRLNATQMYVGHRQGACKSYGPGVLCWGLSSYSLSSSTHRCYLGGAGRLLTCQTLQTRAFLITTTFTKLHSHVAQPSVRTIGTSGNLEVASCHRCKQKALITLHSNPASALCAPCTSI